jgi:hypothetical protein
MSEQMELHPGYAAAEAALAVTPKEWQAAARDAVADLAMRGTPFTTDDVLAFLEADPTLPAGGVETRALGAVMRKAQKDGWITPGGYVTSTRRESHQRPKRLWIPAG